MYIERIHKDERQWQEAMLPKLTSFYFTHVLPELAVPRQFKTTGIRRPSLPWFDPSTLTTSSPKAGPSQPSSLPQVEAITGDRLGGKRKKNTKFVGRRILHRREEEDGTETWYSGKVTGVSKGQDGQPGATYQVYYDKEDATYDVENLHQDYTEGSLRFSDI